MSLIEVLLAEYRPSYLRYVVLEAANDAYESEVIQTEMEDLLIGPDLEFADKDDWIEYKLREWLENLEKKHDTVSE
jgi:hypothetical protein